MQISKWGMILIFIVFFAMIVAIIGLAVPPIGEALANFGINILGPNVMTALTFIFTTPLAWGAQSLIYAVPVWAGITLLCVGLGYLMKRKVINKLRAPKLPKIPPITPQSQLTTPQLYTPPQTNSTSPPESTKEVKVESEEPQ